MTPAKRVAEALTAPDGEGGRRVAFLTGGHPSKEAFPGVLAAVAGVVDVVEIGVPFSDPMADGVTIQRASADALRAGVNLRWILATVREVRPAAPTVLMSYLNPLLAFGFEALADAAVESGVSGFIVPDLPFDEAAELRACLERHGLALVPLVTTLTPPSRRRAICASASGFVYAVTATGTTGGSLCVSEALGTWLQELRSESPVPVLAGFGVRGAAQARALDPYCDGVIVGSALLDLLDAGGDPVAFLQGLR